MIFGGAAYRGGPDPAKRWFVTVFLFILRKLASALAVMFTVSLLVYLALEVNVGDVAVKVLGQFSTPAQRAQWLTANGDLIGAVCRHDLATAPLTVFDWTAGSRELAELNALPDVPARSALLFKWLERAGSVAGVGRYLENRAVYTDRLFQTDDPSERRSVHLGIDLFLPSREVIMAPLDGRVHLVANNPAPEYKSIAVSPR